jgi:predicted hydrocarbon binding protein
MREERSGRFSEEDLLHPVRSYRDLAENRPVIQDDNAGILARLEHDADPFRFYRLMFRTIRVSLLNEGINIDPVLQKAGYHVGERIYSCIAAQDLLDILDKTAGFWKTNNWENRDRKPATACA